MNIFIPSHVNYLCGVVLMTVGGMACATPTGLADPEGVLKLYDGNTLVCTLPFVTSQIDFTSSTSPCDNDKVKEFILERVPSATYFAFYDDPDCDESGNFAYRFKTVKHNFTMEKEMNIETAGEKEVNTVVIPGVLLISSVKRGQVDGKLSCVKIERSAVPTP